MKKGYAQFILSFGVPTMSITPNGIIYNKAVLQKLGFPKYVNLFINPSDLLVAIEPTQGKGINGCEFFRNPKQLYVRWNNKDLLRFIQFLTGWDLSVHNYSTRGEMDYKENIMEFDLKEATWSRK